MAGANAKRIAQQNGIMLSQLQRGVAFSTVVYLIHLLIFKSGRTWFRLFLFLVTEAVEIVLWRQLVDMGNRGDDLKQEGLTANMFDVIYITWATHIGAALITTRAWLLILLIPGYAIYKIVTLALPFFRGGAAAASAGGGRGNGPAGSGAGTEQPKLSKTQEKKQKRAESGQVRIQRR